MDLSPCTYESETDAGAVLMAQAAGWNPPAGHPDWCNTQRAPWLRLTLNCPTARRGIKNAPAACNCPRNTLAKRLRKLDKLHAEGRC